MIFIKSKYIISIVILILIIIGVGIVVNFYGNQNNQQDNINNDNTQKNTTNINNTTNNAINPNITNKIANNKINTKNINNYQKNKPNPQEKDDSLLITKNQAITIAKQSLESYESKDAVSNNAKLIKVGKKHFWVIKKYDYKLYIDAKTGNSVNPKL